MHAEFCVVRCAVCSMALSKSKSILVSYLQRNKILKIPDSPEGDVGFLEAEFKKEFKFESNVNLVTFQRYDGEWGEYVDLDDDYSIANKEKLKAIVTPILVTPPATDLDRVSQVRIFLDQQ